MCKHGKRQFQVNGSGTMVLLAACWAVIGFQQAAQGQAAVYIADAHAVLTVVTPASVNEFGFATNIQPMEKKDDSDFYGDALPFADDINRPVHAGVESYSLAQGYATGYPFIPAHASSYAKTSTLIMLGNLTGGPDPSLPPAIPLTIKMHLAWDWTVTATAMTADDRAYAHILIAVTSPGMANPLMFLDTANAPPNESRDPSDSKDFTVTVPANTVLPIQLRTLAEGYADSVRPPDVFPPPTIPVQPFTPVPEPSTLVYLGTSAFGLVGIIRRRLKTIY